MKGGMYQKLDNGGAYELAPLRAAVPSVPPPAYQDPEVVALMQRKCRLCHQFYTNATAKFFPCQYHPGKFRDPETINLRKGAATGWSCCCVAERVQMPAALSAMAFMPGVSEFVYLTTDSQRRDCVGCVRAEQHVEDLEYTKTMESFPVNLAGLREAHRARCEKYMQAQNTPGAVDLSGGEDLTPTGDDTETIIDNNYFLHQVKQNETLIGLSLHYRCSVDDIRQANQGYIVGDMFKHLRYIRIPRVDGVRAKGHVQIGVDEARQIVLKDFVRMAKKISKENVSKEEATYYCDMTDYILSDAVNMYKEDLDAVGQ